MCFKCIFPSSKPNEEKAVVDPALKKKAWDVKHKAINIQTGQTNKRKTHRHRQQCGCYHREMGEG